LSAIPREELSRRLRRQFARFTFQVKAEVVWQAGTSWGRVTDLSRGGLFIEMAEPPCPGTHFTASLALNVPLKVDCVVRHVIHGRGIGVALSVPEQSKKRFEALLLALSAGGDPARTAAKAPRPEPPRTMAKAAAATAKT
jgi:PilZ domain-containing protein